MKRPKAKNSDALDIIYDRYYSAPESRAALDEERINARISRNIRALRTRAGLSQRALADLVGTTASVICRLEDADYDGHSLAMLRRIAAALKRRVDIRFVPIDRRLQSA